MARPKKPTYEFIPSRNEYRKRIKGPDGKYIALYAQTPDELTEKVALAQRQIEEAVYRRENPTVREYAEKWLTMQASSIRVTTLADYTSKVKIYIIEPLGDRYMQEITPDDVKMAITKAASKSASIYRSVQMLYKLIFTSAEQSKIIDESPCKNLNPKGGKAPKEKTALTTEQVQTQCAVCRHIRLLCSACMRACAEKKPSLCNGIAYSWMDLPRTSSFAAPGTSNTTARS